MLTKQDVKYIFTYGTPSALISGDNPGRTPEVPSPSTHKLSQDLWLADYTIHLVKGVWQGQAEPTVLIPSISVAEAKAYAIKYGQEAFIWGTYGLYGLFTVMPKRKLTVQPAKALNILDTLPDTEGYTEIETTTGPLYLVFDF
jgi:hypothetical protein